MKKCPTCDKEFPDSMRFCQTDGTVLIDAAPSDPYKTTVGNQSDIAAAIPPVDPFKTMVASPPRAAGGDDDDVLQLPDEPDNLKTTVVSQEEMNRELNANAKDDQPLDLPPQYAPSAPLIEPKPPKSPDSSLSPPSFGDLGGAMDDEQDSVPTVMNAAKDDPPPSPFGGKPSPGDFSTQSPYGNQDNKPIPSPFQDSMPPSYQPPSVSPFDTPKPVKETDSPFGSPSASSSSAPPSSPFDAPSPFGQPEPFNNAPVQESTGWSPPPAPVSEWGNQELGANTPFQPPVAGGGQEQTLAIISLILGIFSFICGGILLAIPAIILAYMQKNNIKRDPARYGGGTMATIGMILGIVNSVLTVIILVIYAILLVSAAAR